MVSCGVLWCPVVIRCTASHDMEMAASELSHPSTSNTSLLSSATLMRSLHQYKEKATDHLLLRDFEECKKTCDNGIAFAKLHIEEERS